MTSPPRLDTPEARRAYRNELLGVAAPLRRIGFALVLLGASGWVWASRQEPLVLAATSRWFQGMLGVGWAFLLTAIGVRTRYHRRRMAGK